MLAFLTQTFADLMARGGPVMWVLLLLSIVAVTLSFERGWFWLRTNHPRRRAMLDEAGRMLRSGRLEDARRFAASDQSVYGRLVARLAESRDAASAPIDAIEAERPHIERFMPTLSTVITAAPMLGILGTVLGLIAALNIMGTDQSITDPRQISPAIGEALISTAAGLVVALIVLFPYNAFRAQISRTLGRFEALVEAAVGTDDS
ncbi:MAG: hypothetical protein CMJ18_23205 [Phycisphaeraceae bacterium]|nr:hypothetical protein [Phycisphaeraceae bacterium]